MSESRPTVWVRLVYRREPLHPQATLPLPRQPAAGAQRDQQQMHAPKNYTGETNTTVVMHLRTQQILFLNKICKEIQQVDSLHRKETELKRVFLYQKTTLGAENSA